MTTCVAAEKEEVLVHPSSQALKFVFQTELFFFQKRNALFIPAAMRHLRLYEIFKMLMLIRQFFYMRF